MLKRWAIGFSIFMALLVVALYIINPSGTYSTDPRARISGYMPYRIPSGSMEPTIYPGDYILASSYAYKNSDPSHGDVITFRYPRNPRQTWIKRVVGVPGDTVELRFNKLYRNGQQVAEPYARYAVGKPRGRAGKWRVPADMYFVLGDNRDHSADSRLWGFVSRGMIEGRAMYIFYSEAHTTGPIQAGGE